MNQAILDKLWLSRSYSMARFITLTACGVILLSISAKIQVPFYPVPMTLQTFALLMVCVLGGMRLGMSTVVSYLAIGAMGMPVFANGGGVAILAGPTAGYLYGFVVAALIIGNGIRWGLDKTLLSSILLMAIAISSVFLCGWLWLGSIIGYPQAWAVGVLPFILGDLAKIVLAATSYKIIQKITE